MAGALHVSREAGAPVRVISPGPFSVGSKVWRDARGRLVCTVVAKATYELAPGESAPLDVPCPIQEEDAHEAGDRSRSVRVPSDLAPFKRAAEVVVVGSAFAPQPAPSILARVRVGSVDKSIEVFPPRHIRPDGSVEAGASAARYPLGYEHAAGGPDTENPAGIDVTRPDARGRFPVPQILPPSHALRPSSHVPTCGLGAIASTWPSRAGLLGSHDRAWLRQPSAASMPPAFPPNFFQAAPPDQWLDRPLSADEQIVLEGLCPEVGRLLMSLSGVEPRAIVAGPRPEVVRLAADLLFVDTERGVCTLTFRGQIPVEGRGARVIVVGVPAATELSPEDVRRIVELDREDVETTHVEGPADPPPVISSHGDARKGARAVLPFTSETTPRAAMASNPDGVLPAAVPVPTPPPPVRIPPPAPALVPAPPPVSAAAPPPPVSVPAAISVPAHVSVPVQPPVAAPVPAVVPVPAPAIVAPPPPLHAPAPAPVAGTGAGMVTRLAPASFDAAFGGVKAASDAAIKAASREAPADGSRERMARAVMDALTPRASPRQAVVSLVQFDAAIAPRLRRASRFAAAFAPKARPKRGQGVDTPQEPRDERSDVLRVLSFVQPADAAEIRRALTESLEEVDELDPPLLLVAGELRPTFDEVEMLRATVAVVKQVAGGEKKVLASIGVGQEALAAPIPPRSETALGLVRQIEQAASSLSLPPRYVPLEVERVLVEGRKYKQRTLLGAARVRADLTLAKGGETMPFYLPESAASSLPLLVAFPVVALCEVIPREDFAEAQDEALLAKALGRVVRSR